MNARGLRLGIVGVLCALSSGLVLFGAPAAALAAAPKVEEESLLDASSGSATFQAKINPEGSDTRYRFEYDTRAYAGAETHGQSIPSPAGDVGSGTQGVTVEANPQDLRAATVYHFRVVAESSGGTAYGADETLTTQPAGTKLVLADGRVWEQVSPVNKYGSGIEPLSFYPVQSNPDGSAITYDADAPISLHPNSSLLLETQILSRRGPSGWSSQDVSPPTEEVAANGSFAQYNLFSTDLSLAVIEPLSETPLAPGGVSERTTYLRTNATDSYRSLGKAARYFTSTPDLSHIVVSAGEGLQEWSAGQVRPITSCPGGFYSITMPSRHWLSVDGSRIVCGGGNGEPLYLNDIARGEAIRLDTVASGSGAEEQSPLFQTASSDGSRIIFTDGQRLTANSNAKGFSHQDIYEFTVTSRPGEKLAGELTDLTVPLNSGEPADVSQEAGVLDASEDGSYVYFIAGGQLAPGAPKGGFNLYMSHGGTPTFIATLSPKDIPSAGFVETISRLDMSVSHDGRYLAFMSQESPTGYDNRDVNSGEPDEEVYLYDAGANHLVCASCNPTGARPLGLHATSEVRDGTNALVDRQGVWTGYWLAAMIPGWTKGLYQTRYLSEDGRLFFDSSDALVPQDTNGKMDVYEYEPEGIGSCNRSSATFSERSGGCVGLISSGASGEESQFMEASEGGNDVFFLTAAQLSSQDHDNGLDIYDAHVCSEAVPCATGAVSPPPCVTADSCRAAPLPQPTIFGASGSATFSGAGNLAPQTPPATTGPKPATNGQKLAKALRACHAKRQRARRRRCEAQARRRYRVASKAKNTTRRGK